MGGKTTYIGVLQGGPEGQDAVYMSFGNDQNMLFSCRPDVAEGDVPIVLQYVTAHKTMLSRRGEIPTRTVKQKWYRLCKCW